MIESAIRAGSHEVAEMRSLGADCAHAVGHFAVSGFCNRRRVRRDVNGRVRTQRSAEWQPAS
jgi:hypothetical protein